MKRAALMWLVGCTGAPKSDNTAGSVGQVAQEQDDDTGSDGGETSGAGSGGAGSGSETGDGGGSGSGDGDDGGTGDDGAGGSGEDGGACGSGGDGGGDGSGGEDGAGDGAGGDTSVDSDGDGWSADEDCDDDDASVYPGAIEDCDPIDRDCDGLPTRGAYDVILSWLDADGDGFGDSAVRRSACWIPSGYVENSDDCDDSDAAVNPDADEVCNGVDDDCDSDVDDDDPDLPSSERTEWFQDADGDGFGDACSSSDSCQAPSGFVVDATDCDDGDSTISPLTTCGSIWDGDYPSSISIDITVPSLGLTDTCAGTGTMSVTGDTVPALNGSLTCTAAGFASSLFPGSQAIELTGNFDSDNDASGSITVSSAISDSWTGSFSCPAQFSASTTGSDTLGGVSYSYVVSITATR